MSLWCLNCYKNAGFTLGWANSCADKRTHARIASHSATIYYTHKQVHKYYTHHVFVYNYNEPRGTERTESCAPVMRRTETERNAAASVAVRCIVCYYLTLPTTMRCAALNRIRVTSHSFHYMIMVPRARALYRVCVCVVFVTASRAHARNTHP